jgi:uncharacterized protein YegJ (DUF2314 family)
LCVSLGMRAATLALAFVCSLASAQEKRDENEVVFAGESDPDMASAIRQARATLDEFLSIAASPPANASGFKLKAMVKDGPETEHFWVTPFRVTGSGFEGILANQPRVVRNVRAGQVIKFSRAEVSDWGYVRDGRQIGSFTVCALFKKMPKEQSDYYRKNHGFDC